MIPGSHREAQPLRRHQDLRQGSFPARRAFASTHGRRFEVLHQGRFSCTPERRSPPLHARADHRGDGDGVHPRGDDSVRRTRSARISSSSSGPTSSRGPPAPPSGLCTRRPAEGGYFPIDLMVAPLGVGILFVFAMSGQSIIGAAIAGWSSDNKFSLMGALRAASQMVSYRQSDPRHVAHRGDDDLRHGAPRRHGSLAERQCVGHLRATARVLLVFRRFGRGEQAHPVRLARGREAS